MVFTGEARHDRTEDVKAESAAVVYRTGRWHLKIGKNRGLQLLTSRLLE